MGKSNGNIINGSTKENNTIPPKPGAPSLIEQLFPERYAAGSSHRGAVRQVPTIPAHHPVEPAPPSATAPVQEEEEKGKWRRARELKREMKAQPPHVAVLVLRNAGKNLTLDDFRRVIPQGKHLEGWTLEQGDILRAIPGRDMATLEPTGDYYLLFSSPLSAFTYQGHVTRIHRLVATNTPSSLLSPIAAPPGYMIEGMDVHDAINSFSLISPDLALQVRQLKPPLAPGVQALVEHGGYEPLMLRKDRMPHEVRLTLEGPQLRLPVLRHILRLSAHDRGLNWSGGDDAAPKLTEWVPTQPRDMPSLSNHGESALKWAERHGRDANVTGPAVSPLTGHKRTSDSEDTVDLDEMKRRAPRPVYIAGFHTDQAMQSFLHFWHERSLTWEGAPAVGVAGDEWDLPPIAHVQALW